MAYRDDRDALLARLDALEREVEVIPQLRARIAQLEAEGVRLGHDNARLRAELGLPDAGRHDASDAGVVLARVSPSRGPANQPRPPYEIALVPRGGIIQIGRAPKCQLHLDDPKVDRMHA